MLGLAALPLMAQTDEAPQLKVNATGRLLIDGAMFAGQDENMFSDGVAIPDARLGVKMSYGKWKGKVDIGFAYGKVGMKDIFLEYDLTPQHLFKVGSFIHQYGLQSSTSSSMKCTMEEPVSNAVFNDPRQIGVQYQYNGNEYMGTISAHAEPSASKFLLSPNEFTHEGLGFRSRQVYRPIHSDGMTLQVGISGSFATPQRRIDGVSKTDQHDGFLLQGTFPTRIQSVTAVSADVTHARHMWKLTPELLMSYGPFAVESQYYYNTISRKHNLQNYDAQGAYVMGRALLTGGSYDYAMVDGGLATPKPGSLELVCMYNYTDLSDGNAGINGGRLNDYSATLNYYVNKYVTARLHYSYTYTWDRAGVKDIGINGFMGRIQVIF